MAVGSEAQLLPGLARTHSIPSAGPASRRQRGPRPVHSPRWERTAWPTLQLLGGEGDVQVNGRRIDGNYQSAVNRRDPGEPGVLRQEPPARPQDPPSGLHVRRLRSSPACCRALALAVNDGAKNPADGHEASARFPPQSQRAPDTPAWRQQTRALGQVRRHRDISRVASTLGRNPDASCHHDGVGAESRQQPVSATWPSPQIHFLFS